MSFSALQRAEIAEMRDPAAGDEFPLSVSVLFNEPKLLKCIRNEQRRRNVIVSVLFNEPKLLKSRSFDAGRGRNKGFSALQRAEIAEMLCAVPGHAHGHRFSALQRAEIAEIPTSAPFPTSVPDPNTRTSPLLSLPVASSQHLYLSMDGRVSQLDFCARTASSCETRRFPFQSAKRCKNG